jgi:hypothetical protein
MKTRWALARLLPLLAPVLLVVLPAGAADIKCGDQTLRACTQRRVEALRRLSTELTQAAARQPAVPPADPKAAEAHRHYDRWLAQQSEQAMKLADRGQEALLQATKDMQETQMSFNLQYLQLQSQMQHENPSFTAISNIMKTKHDTVKNSISNVR